MPSLLEYKSAILEKFPYDIKLHGNKIVVYQYWEPNGCKNDDDCSDRGREIGLEIIKSFPNLEIVENYCHRHKYAFVELKIN
jgi:hypothetical protein